MKTLFKHIVFSFKNLFALLFIALLTTCTSTKLISNWKNPNINSYTLNKVLVIGVTPNIEARKAYELEIVKQLNARNINALQSAVVFKSSFIDSEQTEKEIEAEVDILLDKGFETVLVSLVKGVNNNQSYVSESSKTDYHLRKFVGYYLLYQEAYFNQDYYKKYDVFNIETSIYSLKKDTEKSLIWRSNVDLIDPTNNKKAISSYSKKIIKVLERDKILPKKIKTYTSL